jgi:hypothetical protein
VKNLIDEAIDRMNPPHKLTTRQAMEWLADQVRERCAKVAEWFAALQKPGTGSESSRSWLSGAIAEEIRRIPAE